METRVNLKPWLTSLYVAEQQRRQGIDTKLVAAIEQKAVALGINTLYLFTTDAAIIEHIYAKLNWKVREKTRYHSYPAIILEKTPVDEKRTRSREKSFPKCG